MKINKGMRGTWTLRVLALIACTNLMLPLQLNAQLVENNGLDKKFLGHTLGDSAGVYITLKDVNVRKAPFTKSAKVGIVRKGVRLVAVGRAKGTKWIGIKKNGKEFGFIYGTALTAVLDGKLNSSISGVLNSDGKPTCNYTINFDAKHKVSGDPQITSDYSVTLSCIIKGKKVKFSATMFITELPYKERRKNIFQVNLDLPGVVGDDGEVVSVISLYNLDKRILVFEAVTNSRVGNKISGLRKSVKSIPEILKAAVEFSYRIWGPNVWKRVEYGNGF